MGFLFQPFANPAQSARSISAARCLGRPWRPALLLAVAFQHVFRGVASRDSFTRMARDQLLLVIDLKQGIVASMELNCWPTYWCGTSNGAAHK